MLRLLSRLKHWAASALLVTAAPALAVTTASAEADPAIWMVQDADTTIYLFGTVHALDKATRWFDDEVKDAFDRSGELVVEVVTPEDPAELQKAMAARAFATDGKALRDRLTSEGRARLEQALAGLGQPVNAFDHLKPFFASLALSQMQFAKAGLTSGDGVEAVLRAAAKARAKPVGAVETMDFQLGLMDSLPEAEQVRLLEQALGEMDQMDEDIARMFGAWARGDADRVAEIVHESESDSRMLYEKLFVERNRRWADWIERRLDRPGTVFMAVGAGHLAGKDSVQAFLAGKSIDVLRIDHAHAPAGARPH